MTDANPAFDTVHPSGHILVRSCRGGYMHSVALSAEAMDTDAESLAQAILLTDVSCLKALLEVRNEIVAPGHTPSAEVPTPTISMWRSKNCWRINCAAAAKARIKRADGLKHPGPGRIGIGCDIGWRLDGVGAEQLSRAAEQRTHLVELLLQRRISHVPTLPRPGQRHNSPREWPHPGAVKASARSR
jgi:hypothetical protein